MEAATPEPSCLLRTWTGTAGGVADWTICIIKIKIVFLQERSITNLAVKFNFNLTNVRNPFLKKGEKRSLKINGLLFFNPFRKIL